MISAGKPLCSLPSPAPMSEVMVMASAFGVYSKRKEKKRRGSWILQLMSLITVCRAATGIMCVASKPNWFQVYTVSLSDLPQSNTRTQPEPQICYTCMFHTKTLCWLLTYLDISVFKATIYNFFFTLKYQRQVNFDGKVSCNRVKGITCSCSM